MALLLDELKQEHKQILAILDDIRNTGITTPSGRDKLLAAKSLLLSHISKEDSLFYPSFKKIAERDGDLQRLLRYFSDDMKAVSKKALDVFDKYSQGSAAGEFQGELSILCMTLKDRIRTEETTLFRKYEQLDHIE